MNRVPDDPMFASTSTRSISAFVIPITLTGLQALSVEMPTTASTWRALVRTARTSASAPSTLVRTASMGKYSQVGTCFSAAACTTMSASATASRTVG